MTDWRKLAGDLDSAAGSRLFLIDDEDRPIFEARTIEFDSVVAQTGTGT